MNCKQAKQNIALFAGNDLDPMSTGDLKRHLKECPGCVEQWQRMRASVETLQTHSPTTGPIEDSVWPEIVVRLPKQRTVRQRPNRFNGWAPSLAVVAACGLMLMIARWNVPAGGRPGASIEVPAGHINNINAVFAPDSPAFNPVFTSPPAPVGDELRPYKDLMYNAYREVDAASTSNGRGGSNRPLSNRKW